MCVKFEKDITYLPLAKHVLQVDFPALEIDSGAPSTFLPQAPLGAKDGHRGQRMLGAERCHRFTQDAEVAVCTNKVGP